MSQRTSSLPTIVSGKNALKTFQTWLRKNAPEQTVILCDSNTLQHCWPVLLQHVPQLSSAALIETDPGESSKSLEIAAYIWQTLTEQAATRKTLLINLGGGMITDLGGFCAALYKRGIPFVHIPTSLLAMVDAGVGGKTAIDFMAVKNLIGTFSNPVSTIIDPVFLKTLPAREWLCGEAEVYKIAAVANASLWRTLTKKGFSPELIEKAVRTKQRIVKKDPYEKNSRQCLNFGHTIGHALESAKQGTLLHGEAIAIGMYIETELAAQLKLITREWCVEMQQALMWRFDTVLQPIDGEALRHFLVHDKKNQKHKLVFALPAQPGHCHINVVATPTQIQKAIAAYNKCMK
jgi:3-dehydroquinate synthase